MGAELLALTSSKSILIAFDKTTSARMFRLISSSSRNKLSTTTFHSQQSNVEFTLTIVKKADALVIGGYSNARKHDNPGTTRVCDAAFFCVLPGSRDLPSIRLKMKSSGGDCRIAAIVINGQPQDLITLNVNGIIMVTSRISLQLCKASQLASKYLGAEDTSNCPDSYCFEDILHHLQCQHASVCNSKKGWVV